MIAMTRVPAMTTVAAVVVVFFRLRFLAVIVLTHNSTLDLLLSRIP